MLNFINLGRDYACLMGIMIDFYIVLVILSCIHVLVRKKLLFIEQISYCVIIIVLPVFGMILYAVKNYRAKHIEQVKV